MKKIMTAVTILTGAGVIFAGCSNVTTSKSYTFSVDTGDSVELKLDTTDGYDLTSDIPFSISKDGEVLAQGTFMQDEAYEYYVSLVESDAGAEIIEDGSTDDYEYTMWNFNDEEFNYAILINDSDTALLLGCNVSEEVARECFERLTITLD